MASPENPSCGLLDELEQSILFGMASPVATENRSGSINMPTSPLPLTDCDINNDNLLKKILPVVTSGSSNPVLPHQLILRHILTRLPPKNLFRCSCVCTLWRTTILHNPHFAASHFLQYSQKNPCLLYKFGGGRGETDSFYLWPSSSSGGGKEESDGVDLHKIETNGSEHNKRRELIGSCNGLVCLFDPCEQIIEICNPTRRQVLAIKADHHYSTKKSYRFGFGYDSLSEEYKVVYIDAEMCVCMVYSLGTKTSYWREIAIDDDKDVLAKISNDDDDDCFQSEGATFCNGALYWIQGKELVSFHLDKAKFQVIQLPTVIRYNGFSSRLLVHKGSLCFVNISANLKSVVRWSVELFVLQDEQVWEKESIRLPYYAPGGENQLVDFLGQLLLHRTVFRGLIGICNLNTRKDNKVIRRNPPSDHWVCCGSYVDNFLSLHTFVQQGVPHIEVYNF